MRKIIIGMSILISGNLFAANNLDSQVIKTYQYMSNDNKFHYICADLFSI